MKKSILFASLAAALMSVTSCSSTSDEAPVETTGGISFSSTLNKSRALNSIEDLNTFYVYGSKDGSENLFLDQLVGRASANDTWEYTYNGAATKPKWVAGSYYKFYAYSSDNGKIKGTVNYDATNGLTFKDVYAGSPNSNYDIVYATAEQVGKMTDNSRVSFRFKHILSQINVTFKNTTTNAQNVPYNVKINSINFANCEVMGDFDGTSWTFSDTKEPGNGISKTPLYFVDNNKTSTDNFALNETKSTVAMYEIPHDYVNDEPVVFRFNVTITNANDPKDTVTKTLQASFNPEWKMGYKYNYTIPVSLFSSNDYIEFNAVSLDDWNEGATSGTLTIQEVQ